MAYRRRRLSRKVTRDEHRIVMERHLRRNLLRTEVVHHKNGTLDNRIESLELMSLSDHSRMHRTGVATSAATKEKLRVAFHYKGENHPSSKLSNNDVAKIKYQLSLGATTRALAVAFGVAKTTIQDIKSGATWAHL